ncbi:MAG TPA: cellulase family glycosylhydrolase [Acidimicrobiales bacterium]|nr:cellulase family glycosylhydrolase [Acidimicrobiales bacterium]
MRVRRIGIAALAALVGALGLWFSPVSVPAGAQAAPVVPSQWIAKLHTEAFGRAPTTAEWSAWQSYYETSGCTTATLRTKAQEVYLSAEFAQRYPESTDKAGRIIALVRGVFSHEPNSSDWGAYTAYANGSKTWAQTVDAMFPYVFVAWVQPSICNPSKPGYGFGASVPLDVRQLVAGQPSRTQAELQGALDAAGAGAPASGPCTPVPVSLHPYETVRVGTTAAAPTLEIPRCVMLTTSGAPATGAYARQGRIVAGAGLSGAICSASEPVTADSCPRAVVSVADGGSLRNVWVSGGAGAGVPPRNPTALGGVEGGETAPPVPAARLSDPLADGTALDLEGWGSEPVGDEGACSGREARRNLVTSYSSARAQTRLGVPLWADGIAVHCEQATVAQNGVVDVTGDAIALHGNWNSRVGNATPAVDARRTQRSTITSNTILSAGNDGRTALLADPTGRCRAQDTGPVVACIEFSNDRLRGTQTYAAVRSFDGSTIDGNTFWTGSRTDLAVGILVGGKAIWGANTALGSGATVTNNTTGGITTRVQTGILVSGMINVLLSGNTATYEAADRNDATPVQNSCAVGNVVFGYMRSSFRAGSQPGVVDVYNNLTCLGAPLPSGGFEPVVPSGSTFVGAATGDPFVPWGAVMSFAYTTDDLARVRNLRQMGVTFVRMDVPFRTVMQSCTQANPTYLANLDRLVGYLEQEGLRILLSPGSSFHGDQADIDAGLNCYASQTTTDQQRWDAQAVMWSAIADPVKGSPAVLGLELFNEPRLTVAKPDGSPGDRCWQGIDRIEGGVWVGCNPVYNTPNGYMLSRLTRQAPYSADAATQQALTRATGQAWLDQMVGAIRTTGNTQPVTVGCIFTSCLGMSAEALAATVDIVSPHIYPKDCSRRLDTWFGPETDMQVLNRCKGVLGGYGALATEWNSSLPGRGTLTELNPDGSVKTVWTFTGSGSGTTTEVDELELWHATGRPVLNGETAELLGDGLVGPLIDESMTAGLTAGWAVIYNDQVLSKNWVDGFGSTLGVYLNGRTMQRLAREHAVP